MTYEEVHVSVVLAFFVSLSKDGITVVELKQVDGHLFRWVCLNCLLVEQDWALFGSIESELGLYELAKTLKALLSYHVQIVVLDHIFYDVDEAIRIDESSRFFDLVDDAVSNFFGLWFEVSENFNEDVFVRQLALGAVGVD